MKFSFSIAPVSGFLTLLFLVLKLTGTIGWDWIWVISPIWIPLGIGLALTAVVWIFATLAVLIAAVATSVSDRRKRRT